MLINLDNAGVAALSGRSKLLLNSVELCSLSSDWHNHELVCRLHCSPRAWQRYCSYK